MHAIEFKVVADHASRTGMSQAESLKQFDSDLARAVEEMKPIGDIWPYPKTLQQQVNLVRYTEALPEIADTYYCSDEARNWMKTLGGRVPGTSVTYQFAEKYLLLHPKSRVKICTLLQPTFLCT